MKKQKVVQPVFLDILQPQHFGANDLMALNWLIAMLDNNLNGILTVKPTSGKINYALSILEYLKMVKGYNGPFLIMVPFEQMNDWLTESDKTQLTVLKLTNVSPVFVCLKKLWDI